MVRTSAYTTTPGVDPQPGPALPLRAKGEVATAPLPWISRLPLPLVVVLVAVLYYLGAWFGRALAPAGSLAPSLWPPNAILLAALLVYAPRDWPGFLAGVIPLAILADVPAAIPPLLSASLALANTLGVVATAALLRRGFLCAPCCATPRTAWAFFLAAVVMGPAIGSLAATGFQSWLGAGSDLIRQGRDWLLSTALAQLTLAPALLVWAWEGPLKLRSWPRARLIEAGALAGGVLFLCVASFIPSVWRPGELPLLAYASVPLLAWILIRFGARGSFSTLFVVTLVATANTARPADLVSGGPVSQSALSLQGFLLALGTPLFFLSVLMQERHVTELALRRSASRYRELVDESPDGIVLAVSDGTVCDLNRKTADLLGCPAEEIIGTTLADFVPPEDLRAQPLRLTELRQQGKLQVERRLRRRDGSLIAVEMNSRILEDGRILSFIRDIGERKRTEAELHRLVTVVAQSADAILLTDARGRLEYVNPAFERITGYSAAEVLGRNPSILKSGRQPAAFYDDMWHRLSRGEVWYGVFSNRRKDGVLVELQATISPIYDPNNVLTGFVAIEHDITEQVRLEARLRQAQKMEAVGQLAGGVAHDFNNILTVIRGHLSLLREGGGSASELQEALQEIDHASKRAADLTRQLLAFSRRQVLQRQPVDLNDLIANLARMLDRLLGEHIRLRLVPRPNLPAVEADPSMIEQVVLNLAVNARDAMPKFGTLTITTHTIELDRLEGSRHKNAQPGRYACISVHDTGTGISAETLEHIFEPFFTTKEAGKGTGLGLATVDGILEQHKGWIEVTSIPGEGSEFRVYLPAGSGAVEPKAPPAAEPKAASGHETLLLVEDEDVVRNLLRTYLGRQGYRVISAQSAPQALELFRREPQHFAALITDMVMPGGMTGRELADHVRQLRPDIPLIFMSGYSLEFASDGLPVGHGVRFLCKPFEPSELGRTVREVLDLPPTGGTRNARPAVVKANA